MALAHLKEMIHLKKVNLYCKVQGLMKLNLSLAMMVLRILFHQSWMRISWKKKVEISLVQEVMIQQHLQATWNKPQPTKWAPPNEMIVFWKTESASQTLQPTTQQTLSPKPKVHLSASALLRGVPSTQVWSSQDQVSMSSPLRLLTISHALPWELSAKIWVNSRHRGLEITSRRLIMSKKLCLPFRKILRGLCII